ncbi:MAG: methyltransferase domain-containing protein [Methanobacteriota archaeon]
MKMSTQNVIDYYEKNWPMFVKLWQVDKTYCIHYGYYEKGVHSHIQSVYNMNDFIDRLLELRLKQGETKSVLDAGSGIGGTVVHLAKKYPSIDFTGITVIPHHVQMAEQFATENHVSSNTRFFIKDYLDTDFPSNYFDAIFSIEAINYTSKGREFVHEMQRILKPRGKLVVIDAFRTDVQLNQFLNTFYIWFCKGRSIPGLMGIEEFKTLLKEGGFTEIEDKNLSNNVQRSVIRGNLMSIPYLLSTVLKKIIRGRKYLAANDPSFPTAVSIFSSLIGLKKGVTYNAIIATKK